MLCPRCRVYTQDRLPGNPYHIVYQLDALKSDTRKRCSMCDLLWKSLKSLLGEDIDKIYKGLSFTNAEGEGSAQDLYKRPMRADLHDSRQGRVRVIRLQFYVEGGSLPWSRLGPAPPISENALDEQAVRLVKDWIQQCCDSHDDCRPSPSKKLPSDLATGREDDSKVPSRLVHIPRSGSAVRLVDMNRNASIEYAALSHCWGTSKALTMTTTNIGCLKRGLSVDTLPLTFRDAVMFTRELGLEYLWIDSLCIIQDSPEDWAYEASRMADVYKHAKVTISADAVEDCTTGFLSGPGRRTGPVVSTPFDFNSGGVKYSGVLCMREKGLLMRELPIHGWHSNSAIHEMPIPILNGPGGEEPLLPTCLAPQFSAPSTKLSTRGWVFQERLLASRTIHFGPSELGWECRTCIKCECTANSMRSKRGTALLKGVFDNGRGDWIKLVQEYTRMDLTVDTHRLPAISGLAAALAGRRPGDTYIAGLWMSSLHDELLWHAAEPAHGNQLLKPRRFSTFYAPTWSWASLITPVKFPSIHKDLPPEVADLEVLHIHYELRTVNKYGLVREGAYLHIRGRVAEVRAIKLPVGIEVLVPAASAREMLPQLQLIRDRESSGVPEQKELFFLFVRKWTDSRYHPKTYGLQGLVLIRSQTIDDGLSFERFGYAYARKGYRKRRKPVAYESGDSSSLSEDDLPIVPSETLWQPFSSIRELKLV